VCLPGDTLAVVGNEGAAGFLAFINGVGWRWGGRRVDFAWDGVPFTVDMAYEAAMRKNLNSRVFTGDPKETRLEISDSRTLYLGHRKRDRFLRVYDRRGPVRCEIEFKGKVAQGVVAEMVGAGVERWPLMALGWLRGSVDFVDSAASTQACRCPLLPWWAEFVEGAERSRPKLLVKEKLDLEPLAIGKITRAVMSRSRKLLAGLRAYGARWLVGQIEFYGKRKWGPEDDALVDELKANQYGWAVQKVADVPLPASITKDEEAPF
jgi:hypothetical protein